MNISNIKRGLKKFWNFVWHDDSLLSWIVCIILAFVVVKFIFFPLMSLITGSPLPIVVVESSSMHHDESLIKAFIGIPISKTDSFETWWDSNNHNWYEDFGIKYENTKDWSFKGGFNKGDIIFLYMPKTEKLKIGNVIVFNPNHDSTSPNPIIHRIVKIKTSNSKLIFETKGDNNDRQLTTNNNPYGIDEININEEQILGKTLFRIPKLGWLKLAIVELINLFR